MNLNFNQPSFGGSSLGKGPFNGFSTVQTQTGYRDTEIVNTRNILKKSWNGPYATSKYTGNNGKVYGRITTPFRAVNNAGDFLGRVDYICGGSHINKGTGHSEWNHLMGSLINNCDSTGVPGSTCNPKYVYDSSDYTRYRKERSVNRNFNDLKDGGFGSSRPIGSRPEFNAYWHIVGTGNH
jgi:hypothetical protein